MIDKINSTLEGVTGVTGDLKKLPEFEKDVKILKNKNIVMVDDDGDAFEAFIPYLLTATNGKAQFIPHDYQKTDKLVKEIMESNAEVVLMDYHLSIGLEGTDVADALIKKGFTGTIIGFSSDPRADQAFKDIGAIGAINKNSELPEESIKKLIDLFSEINN